MSVQEELDLMLKSLNSDTTEAVETVEEPSNEKQEQKVESPPVEGEAEGTKTDEPVVQEEPAATEVGDVEPEPEPEPDEKDRTINELRQKLAEKEETKETKETQGKTEDSITDSPIEEQDFVGELDFDDLSRDPKEFNKVLNKIYQKAVSDTRSGIYGKLPEIVRANVAMVNSLREASETFYSTNKDLSPFKKVVSTVFEELASKEPDKPYGEILGMVGPEVRKRLELPEPKLGEDKKDEKKQETKAPKLPSKGGKAGSGQVTQDADPLRSEIEEMNKTLGR